MKNIIGTKHDFINYIDLKNQINENIKIKKNSLNIYFSNCHSVCYGFLQKDFLKFIQNSFLEML